jgi:hypothetical protein
MQRAEIIPQTTNFGNLAVIEFLKILLWPFDDKDVRSVADFQSLLKELQHTPDLDAHGHAFFKTHTQALTQLIGLHAKRPDVDARAVTRLMVNNAVAAFCTQRLPKTDVTRLDELERVLLPAFQRACLCRGDLENQSRIFRLLGDAALVEWLVVAEVVTHLMSEPEAAVMQRVEYILMHSRPRQLEEFQMLAPWCLRLFMKKKLSTACMTTLLKHWPHGVLHKLLEVDDEVASACNIYDLTRVPEQHYEHQQLQELLRICTPPQLLEFATLADSDKPPPPWWHTLFKSEFVELLIAHGAAAFVPEADFPLPATPSEAAVRGMRYLSTIAACCWALDYDDDTLAEICARPQLPQRFRLALAWVLLKPLQCNTMYDALCAFYRADSAIFYQLVNRFLRIVERQRLYRDQWRWFYLRLAFMISGADGLADLVSAAEAPVWIVSEFEHLLDSAHRSDVDVAFACRLDQTAMRAEIGDWGVWVQERQAAHKEQQQVAAREDEEMRYPECRRGAFDKFILYDKHRNAKAQEREEAESVATEPDLSEEDADDAKQTTPPPTRRFRRVPFFAQDRARTEAHKQQLDNELWTLDVPKPELTGEVDAAEYYAQLYFRYRWLRRLWRLYWTHKKKTRAEMREILTSCIRFQSDSSAAGKAFQLPSEMAIASDLPNDWNLRYRPPAPASIDINTSDIFIDALSPLPSWAPSHAPRKIVSKDPLFADKRAAYENRVGPFAGQLRRELESELEAERRLEREAKLQAELESDPGVELLSLRLYSSANTKHAQDIINRLLANVRVWTQTTGCSTHAAPDLEMLRRAVAQCTIEVEESSASSPFRRLCFPTGTRRLRRCLQDALLWAFDLRARYEQSLTWWRTLARHEVQITLRLEATQTIICTGFEDLYPDLKQLAEIHREFAENIFCANENDKNYAAYVVLYTLDRPNPRDSAVVADLLTRGFVKLTEKQATDSYDRIEGAIFSTLVANRSGSRAQLRSLFDQARSSKWRVLKGETGDDRNMRKGLNLKHHLVLGLSRITQQKPIAIRREAPPKLLTQALVELCGRRSHQLVQQECRSFRRQVDGKPHHTVDVKIPCRAQSHLLVGIDPAEQESFLSQVVSVSLNHKIDKLTVATPLRDLVCVISGIGSAVALPPIPPLGCVLEPDVFFSIEPDTPNAEVMTRDTTQLNRPCPPPPLVHLRAASMLVAPQTPIDLVSLPASVLEQARRPLAEQPSGQVAMDVDDNSSPEHKVDDTSTLARAKAPDAVLVTRRRFDLVHAVHTGQWKFGHALKRAQIAVGHELVRFGTEHEYARLFKHYISVDDRDEASVLWDAQLRHLKAEFWQTVPRLPFGIQLFHPTPLTGFLSSVARHAPEASFSSPRREVTPSAQYFFTLTLCDPENQRALLVVVPNQDPLDSYCRQEFERVVHTHFWERRIEGLEVALPDASIVSLQQGRFRHLRIGPGMIAEKLLGCINSTIVGPEPMHQDDFAPGATVLLYSTSFAPQSAAERLTPIRDAAMIVLARRRLLMPRIQAAEMHVPSLEGYPEEIPECHRGLAALTIADAWTRTKREQTGQAHIGFFAVAMNELAMRDGVC